MKTVMDATIQYAPFMDDAHMGILLMLCGVISMGAIYGFRLSKNRGNFRPLCSPVILSIGLFLYYVGVLMYTPTSLGTFTLVGPYAYGAYGMATVATGAMLVAVTTILWAIVFRLFGVAVFLFKEMWCISEMWFDAFVQNRYEKRAARKNVRKPYAV